MEEGLAYALSPLEGGSQVPTLGSGSAGGSPSLDNYVPKLTAEEVAVYRNRKRKRKRAYQRIKSGLAVGGCLRFITLTSSPDSDPARLGRDLSNLVKRIRRKYGKFEYVAVKVLEEGYGVIHIIARGAFIPQRELSKDWKSLRNAPIVDIRAITRTPSRVGNYIISQYVSNQAGVTRLSWSWSWVYRGFCKVWSIYKKTFRTCTVSIWELHLQAFKNSLFEWGGKPPPIDLGLDRPDLRYEFGNPYKLFQNFLEMENSATFK
ncbi:unnamed protein product [marine sediment metagenome]|uniref:Uncharacterized protein n=2 Tax=marine sediment metagenome TaxID=412755 RepID=X1KTA2_9ZZZZ